ncbi:hypothetical protein Dimus_016580, partial [Dionaea muscipula]
RWRKPALTTSADKPEALGFARPEASAEKPEVTAEEPEVTAVEPEMTAVEPEMTAEEPGVWSATWTS